MSKVGLGHTKPYRAYPFSTVGFKLASRENLAWACGIFEGEGCFYGDKRYGTPSARIAMTDHDVLIRFHEIVQVGSVNGPRMRIGGTKPVWEWTASGLERTQYIIALFWPWLGIRRKAKAAEMLNGY